jgi:ribosomal peptide maturation radical SAM protein 1
MTIHRTTLPLVADRNTPPPAPVLARPLRVALVNMPWALSDRPSVQCGLLKAGLEAAGHTVDVHYLNLALAVGIGADMYLQIAEMPAERTLMLGEWLFTVAAFGPVGGEDSYRAAFPAVDEACAKLGLTFEKLCELRGTWLPQWLDKVMGDIDWQRYDLVGFTSTFEQNVAALAGAARVKRLAPTVPTVFGGANFDGEMGLEFVRRFTDIDYVVTGEGDVALPQLAAALSAGGSGLGLPGLAARAPNGTVLARPPTQVREMDALPVPDFTEYFQQLDRLGRRAALGNRPVHLVVELSRGCWWGEKHHCTFCGLNALGMSYRSKSPRRAIDEIVALASASRNLVIDTVDNILDMRYLGTFCDELAGHGYDLSMFFEVKANLSPEQLRRLRAAGVTRIQPGIESLSTHVLRVMDKGTDLLTNVRLLKWARYHRIAVGWNILTGFPGETDADYLSQAEIMPALHHLAPPLAFGELWMERFSPYFSNPPAQFHDIRPRQAYAFIYPLPDLDLAKIAYFFDHTIDSVVSPEAVATLAEAVQAWRDRWPLDGPGPSLYYQRGPGWIRIVDSRGARRSEQYLDGWQATVFHMCGDSPRTVAGLRRRLAEAQDLPHVPAADELTDFLDSCVARRGMIQEFGRYLSLALPTASRGQH